MVRAQLRCAMFCDARRETETNRKCIKPDTQPAAIKHINHRTGTTMHHTPLHQHSFPTPGVRVETGKIEEILIELRGIREDARREREKSRVVHGDGDAGATVMRREKTWTGPELLAQMQADERQDAAGGTPEDGKGFSTDAPVYDSDHDLQIMGIMGVNAKAGWVLVADLPVQLTEHGHIQSRRLRFSKIIQFDRNDQGSGSFHCYGRLPDGKEGV